MRTVFHHITLILFIFTSLSLYGQADLDPPESPVLTLVSVDQSTNNVEISWISSPSPDVSGYVVYLYRNGEGYELDTIYDPGATSYLRTGSGSGYYSESFVVAALDTAGNISPLSNELSTIFTEATIDTCNKLIEVTWNSYMGSPKQVLSYTLLCSVNGGPFTDAGEAEPGKTSIMIEDFTVDVAYCFVVRANLTGGYSSGSNKTCLLTKMQRPPQWINADYATIANNNEIMLSFTPDPMSEISTFTLERKSDPSGNFVQIYRFSNSSGTLLFSDINADINRINYYRLKAVNNCNNPVTVSNIASNIVLSLSGSEKEINLSWNNYRKWRGNIDSYKLFVSTSGTLEERITIPPGDSTLTYYYSDLMYEVSKPEVCFMIEASEASNPYVSNGESMSAVICIPVSEKITVPNLFTPDNNAVNDFFKPVLSFTPLSYRLIITDLKRKTVFETIDPAEEWDGTRNGNPLPEGVYLWFLNVRTPSGRDVAKSGTVTIMHNR